MRYAVAFAASLLAGCAAAPPCPLPDGRTMARAELFFGRDGVSDAEWDGFVREDLTAAFPQGLTILAGQGQWRDPASGALLRESSRVVIVLLETDGAPEKLAAAADLYEHKFNQASVLVSLAPACAAF